MKERWFHMVWVVDINKEPHKSSLDMYLRRHGCIHIDPLRLDRKDGISFMSYTLAMGRDLLQQNNFSSHFISNSSG